MQKSDWTDLWQRGDLGFHLTTVHWLLKEYWPHLRLKKPATVLVPLCGKSVDLIWFAQQGYSVIGVEWCDLACEAFFDENKISYQIEKNGAFTCYTATNLKIYCGDILSLPFEYLRPIHVIYDRAALIALPPEIRIPYANYLTELLDQGGQMLLISFSCEDKIKNSPPFPISIDEIQRLYGQHFSIERLWHSVKTDLSDAMREKGFRRICEELYLLQKNN